MGNLRFCPILTTTSGKSTSVERPSSSEGGGWSSGGVHTSCVRASEVTLHCLVPMVTFTSDSSLARLRFSPWKRWRRSGYVTEEAAQGVILMSLIDYFSVLGVKERW